MNRPNILFLMSDEHRADVAGYAGNTVVRTPTLDWLASTGVVFSNAYTPSPVCVPGRQSLMAGQLPRTTGCCRFGQDLPPNAMTWARVFGQHAYHATCAGKLHHVGPDQMQGWTNRIAPDAHVDDHHIAGRVESEFARYKPAPGIGKWTNEKEVQRAGVVGDGALIRRDRTTVDAAVSYLDQYFINYDYDRPQTHRPLLLKVSLIQPHYPFVTDREKFGYYLNRVPVFDSRSRMDHPKLGTNPCGPVFDLTPRDLRRATAAYYGAVEEIDAQYRRVLDMLEHGGQNLDDWIIVYTSDHGEMLGEHGIWEKTQFYEASARVPLIIRWPQRFEPRLVNENVNLCDLFVTLCELADLPVPADEQTGAGRGLDSRSLVALMQGRADEWRQRHHNETISQIDRHCMIKRGALKYCWYQCRQGEAWPEVLFDLETDPGEARNVIGEPRYAEVVGLLRQRLAQLGYGPNADANYRNAGYG
ncbi:MAG: sulfatase-like hydrolase/transferase [Phycisphaeraceae bacterium]